MVQISSSSHSVENTQYAQWKKLKIPQNLQELTPENWFHFRVSYVSFLTTPVPWLLPCLVLSHISCLTSFVMSPVSRLLSHVSCLTYPVCLTSAFSWLCVHIDFISVHNNITMLKNVYSKSVEINIDSADLAVLNKPIRYFSCLSTLSGLSGLKHTLF